MWSAVQGRRGGGAHRKLDEPRSKAICARTDASIGDREDDDGQWTMDDGLLLSFRILFIFYFPPYRVAKVAVLHVGARV